MASGVAVVSAAAASSEVLIEDGRTGILCPPDEIGTYEKAIMELVGNPDRRREIGAAARLASEGFSWANASRQAADAYRDVIAAAK
jgi:glycosyltransferase involved in cell wall biosynthesis